jgi:hypothetical protein
MTRAGARRLAVRLLPVVLALVALVLVAASTGPNFSAGNIDASCGTTATVCDVTASLENTGGAGSGVVTIGAMTARLEIGDFGQRSEIFGAPVMCHAAIPRTAHGAVAHVTCRLALPAGTPADYYIVQSSISVDAVS